MKKQLCLFAVLFLLFNVLVLNSQIQVSKAARTWRVPQDYRTIDAAIIAAVDGDTVAVSAGEYLGFTQDKAVTIMGAGSALTLINSTTQVKTSNAALNGLKIDITKQVIPNYALIIQGDHNVISNCEIVAGQQPISIQGNGNTVSSCNIRMTGSYEYAGSVAGKSNLIMASIIESEGNGLSIGDSGGSLSHNLINCNGTLGVYVSAQTYSIESCTVNCTNIGVELNNGQNMALSNCIINLKSSKYIGGGGIYISQSFNSLIRNCTVRSLPVNNGISLDEGSSVTAGENITLDGNTILNGAAGISTSHIFRPIRNVTISHNTINNCTNGVLFDSGVTGMTIIQNNFVNNHNQAIDNGVNSTWYKGGIGNYWSDWVSPDANGDGIVDNPYPIPGTGRAVDRYPMTTQIVIPEFPQSILIMLMIVFTLVGVVFIRKRALKTQD
jgi:hypothetical protein